MHAKITLLPGDAPGGKACEYAEQLLTDISAAFDHTFSLYRGKLEEEPAEKTLSLCESSQGILLGSAQDANASALYDALGLPLRIRSFCVPEALCGRLEKPVKLWIGTVLSLDEDTLRLGMQEAFRFAREEDARILTVSPAGQSKAAWDAAIRVQGAANPLVTVDGISAPEAAAALVRDPGRMGLLLCPPYAGSILEAAATASCRHPEALFDYLPDAACAILGPCLNAYAECGAAPPFSMAMAVSRMLRASLHLTREAACLDAAIQNVMANHPSQGESTEEEAQQCLDLMCNQIAVAGELMGKGGYLS